MDDIFKYIFAVIFTAFCFSIITVLILTNQPDSIHKCYIKNRNPEKFPKLFYNLIHNSTFLSNDKFVFQLNVPAKLNFESKLVAASDTIEHISKHCVFYKYPFTATITYGRAISRNITFFKCFESSILFNELIQMNILPMLKGSFVTLTFWKNQ